MQTEQTIYRKRIQYLIARRATLELECLLGEFWQRYGTSIPDEDLPELERILTMEDLDLLEILLRKRPIPAGYRRDLLEMMMK